MSEGAVDVWVNLVTTQGAAMFLGHEQYANIRGYLGGDGHKGVNSDELLSRMDRAEVATAVLTTRLSRGDVAEALKLADDNPGRFLVGAMVTETARPTPNVMRIRELAQHPRFSMVRVAPLFTQVPINDPVHFPIYQVCEELGLPVGINVGVPGPKVRSRVQHPELLEDVLIAFPELTVIGAHMGHPFEELLINYMRKWDRLYLSCSAYAPKYIDQSLLRFMASSTGRGRVLWASDDPWFPMQRSIDEARALNLDADAMGLFLGAAARRVLDRLASADDVAW